MNSLTMQCNMFPLGTIQAIIQSLHREFDSNKTLVMSYLPISSLMEGGSRANKKAGKQANMPTTTTTPNI